jgi:PAS domain S-box-containing protein
VDDPGWTPSPVKEELTASPRIVRGLRLFARLAAVFVVVIAGAALVGWSTGIRWLANPVGGVAVVPNTAVMLALSGLALGCAISQSRRCRWARNALAATCAVVALATLMQDLVGRDFGIDILLFRARPARPAVPTTVGLLLASAALLLLDVRRRRGVTPAEVLASTTAAISWLALGGYLYGAIQFYVWSRYPHANGIAIMTSVALIALALGIVAARPESGAMGTVTSRHVGGQVARRMLLVALSIPVVAYLAVRAQRAGMYEMPGAAIVEGVAGMMTAIWIAIAVSMSLERTDARRRRLEAQSREWKRFFDRASFGAALGTLDNRVWFVNETFARMHGATIDELRGQPIENLFPPARRAELAEQQRIAAECGQARWESVHFRKDGSTFPVIIDLSAIHDERGVLLYRAAYVQDITREKSAAEARAQLASLVVWAEDAIVAESADDTILSWNQGAARMFGYSAGEVVGGPATVLVPEDRRAEREAVRMRALGGEAVVGFESERVRKDGVRIPIALTMSPIRDEADRITAISVIKRDISAVKRLERQREEWSSVVAHDLRQPSATIRYATESLLRGDDEARGKAVDSICKASHRLERMVGDLLDVSRIEAKRLSVRPQAARLGPLVTEAIDSLPDAPGRCRTDIHPDATCACVDKDRFVQVVSNLISNALKYGSPGAPIDVGAERVGDMVQISVTNEGPGIAPDEIPKLFSRFGRTRSAEKGPSPGLGLGLYMSRGIIEAHGGKIWAESPPGEKTHFRFMLPRASAPGDGASAHGPA